MCFLRWRVRDAEPHKNQRRRVYLRQIISNRAVKDWMFQETSFFTATQQKQKEKKAIRVNISHHREELTVAAAEAFRGKLI